MAPSPTAAIDEYPAMLARNNLSSLRPSGGYLIGPTNHSACPCCNRHRDDGRQTLNEPNCAKKKTRQSLMDEVHDVEEEDDEDSADEHDCLPGVVHAGVEYIPQRILAEGWVHKKGTGNDFFGSRAWKPRYCRLVLAQMVGFSVDVPLLLVYWFPSNDAPSTVISLESTVVVPMDRDDKDEGTKYCFNIVHAKGEEKTTRAFSLAQKGRDCWIFAITEALLNFEKSKSKSMSEITAKPVTTKPVVKPQTGIWSSDTCVEMTVSPLSALSPPISPRSAQRRPLPRHNTLVGESFL